MEHPGGRGAGEDRIAHEVDEVHQATPGIEQRDVETEPAGASSGVGKKGQAVDRDARLHDRDHVVAEVARLAEGERHRKVGSGDHEASERRAEGAVNLPLVRQARVPIPILQRVLPLLQAHGDVVVTTVVGMRGR